MEIEQALLTRLQAVAGVTSLVGTSTSARIYYAGKVPQNVTAPYIVIQKISDVEVFSHDGPTGLKTARLQVNSFDDSYLGAKATAAAVKAGINGNSWTTWSTLTIQICFFDNDTDLPGESYDDLTGIAADYLITYEES
jgi:hypothetical protein